MVQASDLRDSDDVSITRWGRGARDRRVLRQSQMSSGLVVVNQVGVQDATQVPLVENDNVIQALSTDRADYPLNVPVLPR